MSTGLPARALEVRVVLHGMARIGVWEAGARAVRHRTARVAGRRGDTATPALERRVGLLSRPLSRPDFATDCTVCCCHGAASRCYPTGLSDAERRRSSRRSRRQRQEGGRSSGSAPRAISCRRSAPDACCRAASRPGRWSSRTSGDGGSPARSGAPEHMHVVGDRVGTRHGPIRGRRCSAADAHLNRSPSSTAVDRRPPLGANFHITLKLLENRVISAQVVAQVVIG